MDRRRFLRSGAHLFAAGFALPALTPLIGSAEEASQPAGLDLPDLVRTQGDPKAATLRAIEALGGMRRFVGEGQVVVVKPNASFDAPPKWGATTHPEVLGGVIESCLEAGARRVLVVDHTLAPAARAFARTGIAKAVETFPKAKLVSLDDPKTYVEMAVEGGRALSSIQVPALLEKADVLINLPTAKSHSATGVSLGLKNLMGLIWDRHVFHQEMDIHVGIADLASVLRPQLTILDAVNVLKTGGPSGPGDVDPLNAVVAGTDPVAVDALGVTLSTWGRQTYAPGQVGYLREAAERGLGVIDLDTLRILDLS